MVIYNYGLSLQRRRMRELECQLNPVTSAGKLTLHTRDGSSEVNRFRIKLSLLVSDMCDWHVKCNLSLYAIYMSCVRAFYTSAILIDQAIGVIAGNVVSWTRRTAKVTKFSLNLYTRQQLDSSEIYELVWHATNVAPKSQEKLSPSTSFSFLFLINHCWKTDTVKRLNFHRR